MWGVDEIKDYLKDNLKPSRYGHRGSKNCC